jgi:hypothetical protein
MPVPPDQDLEKVVGTEAELVAGHANDAGVARAEHLDHRPSAQAELLESMHVLNRPLDLTDLGRLAGPQQVHGNEFFHRSPYLA